MHQKKPHLCGDTFKPFTDEVQGEEVKAAMLLLQQHRQDAHLPFLGLKPIDD